MTLIKNIYFYKSTIKLHNNFLNTPFHICSEEQRAAQKM